MKLVKATLSITILFGLFLSLNSLAESKARKKEKLIGSVFAYGKFDGLNYFHGMFSNSLIVRTEEKIKGQKQFRYVRIIYQFYFDEPNLPATIFSNSKRWKFSVIRDTGCDVTLYQDGSGRRSGIVPVDAVKSEDVPYGETLPCYTMRPKGFKEITD